MAGERSIRKACGSPSKLGLWGRWSTKNCWIDRCAVFDAEKERIAREATFEEIRVLERERLRLAIRRARYEISQQEQIELMCEQLGRKIDAMLSLPSSDIERVTYGADGSKIRQSVKGLRPGELARAIEAWLALIAVAVHGHVRMSRSERIAQPGRKEPGPSQDDVRPLHLDLVLAEWPIGQPIDEKSASAILTIDN